MLFSIHHHAFHPFGRTHERSLARRCASDCTWIEDFFFFFFFFFFFSLPLSHLRVGTSALSCAGSSIFFFINYWGGQAGFFWWPPITLDPTPAPHRRRPWGAVEAGPASPQQAQSSLSLLVCLDICATVRSRLE